jgi:hypothetical protein
VSFRLFQQDSPPYVYVSAASVSAPDWVLICAPNQYPSGEHRGIQPFFNEKDLR